MANSFNGELFASLDKSIVGLSHRHFNLRDHVRRTCLDQIYPVCRAAALDTDHP